MKMVVFAGISAAALALGGCSWFHSDRSEARNTASPWDSPATRDRQAAELQRSTSPAPSMRVAAGSTASDRAAATGASSAAGTNRAEVKQVQQQLKAAGLYQGPIDGIAGPQTKQALTAFQQAHGLPATGTLDQQTAALLQGGPATATGTSTKPSSSAGATTPPQNRSSTMGSSPSGEPNSPGSSPSDAQRRNPGTSGGAQGGQH